MPDLDDIVLPVWYSWVQSPLYQPAYGSLSTLQGG